MLLPINTTFTHKTHNNTQTNIKKITNLKRYSCTMYPSLITRDKEKIWYVQMWHTSFIFCLKQISNSQLNSQIKRQTYISCFLSDAATVTIVIPESTTAAPTTTTDRHVTFLEDPRNIAWVSVGVVILLGLVALMVYQSFKFNDYSRLAQWCQRSR